MPLSPEQRQRILDAVSSGRLPVDAPAKMYAGYGPGRACAGCDDAIGPKDVEYEAHYDDGRRYYLHLGCAALWEAQRRRAAKAAIEDAARVRQQSQTTREQARMTVKHSMELRDHADVLAAESEEAIEKARRVKRGGQ